MQPSTSDLKKAGEQVQKSATKAYGQAEAAVKDFSKDLTSEAESRLPQYYAKAKDIASGAWTNSLDVAKKYPVSTVVGALVFGYIAGALIHRSSND
jgi:hypothetical protein